VSGDPEVFVVGSVNADLVVEVPRRPGPGETVSGTDLATLPGGKGANQAVAAARLGGRVAMLGRVGRDSVGDVVTAALSHAGVDAADVEALADVPTGVALITLTPDGENSIVVSPGANGRLACSRCNWRFRWRPWCGR
jgi:ribokinase